MLLRKAWSLAIETLSWIELQHLGERLALTRAAEQLRIQDAKAVGLAHKLVLETLRRRNLLDFVINQALAPNTLEDFKLGPQAFLRLFTYETRFGHSGLAKAESIAKLGRSVLGWRTLKEAEKALGRVLGVQLDGNLKKASSEERVALLTNNPLWFVKYCFRLLGRSDGLRFLEGTMNQPSIYLRVNLLRASEEHILEKLKSEGIRIEKVS
ncbi:MAG: hypothetical protein NWE77_03270, partial [Candidatus Bathyarchaeota archaeon]|nr:hypothetical protein [Candidatus Bathyarchaeota archaeon]